MPVALVVIEKERDGETWVNTHAIGYGVGSTLPPNAEAFQAWGASAPFTDDSTNPGGEPGGYAGYLLQDIIGFERTLTWKGVTFKRIYVQDGKKNTAAGTSVYFTADLGFGGLWAPTAEARDIAPGFVTLQINRRAQGYQARRGRMFLRGALADVEVGFIGTKLVNFTDDATRLAVRTRVEQAVTNSKLADYIGVTPDGDPSDGSELYYGLPHYFKPGTLNPGALELVYPLASLVMQGPTNRQVKRGRKEKKSNVPAT